MQWTGAGEFLIGAILIVAGAAIVMLARGGTITLTRIITLPLIILLLLVSGAMTIADGLGLNF